MTTAQLILGAIGVRVRDWWRGYSNADVESALFKIAHGNKNAGGLIPMSGREMRAYIAYYRDLLGVR